MLLCLQEVMVGGKERRTELERKRAAVSLNGPSESCDLYVGLCSSLHVCVCERECVRMRGLF